MGQSKLELLLSGRPVLAQVLTSLTACRLDLVVVVLGPQLAHLASLVKQYGGAPVVLDQPTRHMRETVERGLAWLAVARRPTPDDAWMLLPADHPLVEPAVVAALVEAFQARAGETIIVPTYRGRRGHPILLGWAHVAGLAEFPPEHGIDAYLCQHAASRREVPVESESVVLDLDTPEDFERLRTLWEQRRTGAS
jgi:molybdenum cofactor cytidylyltransferase